MTTAIDTSVLLDILLDDPTFARLSEQSIIQARKLGRLIVCETVIAELRPALTSDEELSRFLDDLGLEFLASTRETGFLAGSIYQNYLKNKGQAKRVLPDFLVAAHAQLFADVLLARDRGYYREYFHNLKVVSP